MDEFSRNFANKYIYIQHKEQKNRLTYGSGYGLELRLAQLRGTEVLVFIACIALILTILR